MVGVVLKIFGTPGEIAAAIDNIHMEHARLDIKQSPAMGVVSLLSIVFGGSAGPEAPLVQITGSIGSWVADRLKLRLELVRTLAFCGMAAALGAFFGAPLGGALFALEIPHRRGLEYYEALLPALTSAIFSFLVFRTIVGYDMPLYTFPTAPAMSFNVLFQGAVMGCPNVVYSTFPNQPLRSIHLATSSTGITLKASPNTINQSTNGRA